MSTPTFNHALCAELHNRIVSIGWSVPHHPSWTPDGLNFWESWFTSHTPRQQRSGQGIVASAAPPANRPVDEELKTQLEQRLAPDVLRFLKAAQDDYIGESQSACFFFTVKGLTPPQYILQNLNGEWALVDRGYPMFPPEEKNRYLRLYLAELSGSGLRGGIL